LPDVAVEINGRSYRVACGPGEEPRLRMLAEHLNERVAGLVRTVGQVGESQLLLVAGLLLADELDEARNAAPAGAAAAAPPPVASDVDAAANDRLADSVATLAARIEAIAAELEAA
jgi:cell division protein ZapA